MDDIKRMFTPEFRNRLDAIVSFKPLDEEIILRVVDKFLLQLESQLAEKKVEVTFTDALRKQLGKKGFDPLMGARPMQRLIQDTIRRALADELLFGRLVEGGRLTIDVDADGKPLLDIQPAQEERQAEGRAGDGLDVASREAGQGASAAPRFRVSVGRRAAGSWRKNARGARRAAALRARARSGATKKASARDGEEFLDRLGAVRIEEACPRRRRPGRRSARTRPRGACSHAAALARRVDGRCRRDAAAHVEDVDELVDDDVVAPPADSPASSTSRQASISGPPSIASPASSSS